MNKTFSLYLDVVRFLAAMGVFISHLVMPRWTSGFFPEGLAKTINLTGVDLVMVFFVLSGFVIAYTVHVKDHNWEAYAFNRGTRIYSVAIPAIIFTFLLDNAGISFNPADYDGWWYADHSLLNLLVRGLTFSNEFWQWEFRIGSNGPYWSLGYEVWYYVLFGILAFGHGWTRIVAFTMIALLVGPAVWLLAPVWAMGVVLYWAYRRGWLTPGPSAGSFVLGAVAAVAPVAIYGALRLSIGNDLVNAGGEAILRVTGLLGTVGRAETFLWFWVIGALVTMHFIGVALLVQNVKVGVPHTASTFIRWLAGGSFSIYLIHYPAMHAIDAMMIGETGDPLRVMVLAIATLTFCFLFAAIFERRLKDVRGVLRSLSPISINHRTHTGPAARSDR